MRVLTIYLRIFLVSVGLSSPVVLANVHDPGEVG